MSTAVDDIYQLIVCQQMVQAFKSGNLALVQAMLKDEEIAENLPWISNILQAFDTGSDDPIKILDLPYQKIASDIVEFLRENKVADEALKSGDELYAEIMAALADHDMRRATSLFDSRDVERNLHWIRRVLAFLVLDDGKPIPLDLLTLPAREFAQAVLTAREVSQQRAVEKEARQKEIMSELARALKEGQKSGSIRCPNCGGEIQWESTKLGISGSCVTTIFCTDIAISRILL